MLSASSASRGDKAAVTRRPPGVRRRPLVQPALLAVLLLPPPAAGADVLAGADGACAGLAADRGKAPRMQRIDGHVVGRDVGLDALQRPVRQRVDLDEAEARVPLGEGHLAASGRLPAPQPGHPAAGAGQRALAGGGPCARRSRPCGSRPRCGSRTGRRAPPALPARRHRVPARECAGRSAARWPASVSSVSGKCRPVSRVNTSTRRPRRGDGVQDDLVLDAETCGKRHASRDGTGQDGQALLQTHRGGQVRWRCARPAAPRPRTDAAGADARDRTALDAAAMGVPFPKRHDTISKYSSNRMGSMR